MCGIAGFRPQGREDERAARRLGTALDVRGPDGVWQVRRAGWWLVQTRLAVIDLSPDVVYPMPNEDGRVWLLFNGEIYDHAEHRRVLEGLGHRFRTGCDAEVVVHGYEEWGADVFRRLDGMFALAVVDERRGEVVLARDGFGIKPLVRTTRGPAAFASDAMALVAAGLVPPRVDHDAVRGYAALHYAPPPATGIEGIEQVEPGSAVVLRADGTQQAVVRWSGPLFRSNPDPSAAPTTADIADGLRAAVRRQLAADVPVGVLLSGGVDSAAVLAAAHEAGAAVPAFTLTFPGFGAYDEAHGARAIARRYATEHHQVPFAAGFADAVGAVADAFDGPFGDASAIATLEVARSARRHVTVLLTGTGGDDLFAGYHRHRAHLLLPVLGRVPAIAADAAARGGGPAGDERRHRGRLAGSYLTRLFGASVTSPVEQYLALVGSQTSAGAVGCLRLPVDVRVARSAVALRHGLRVRRGEPVLQAIQRFELRSYLPGDLLAKEDRATMAVGLEGRLPLLDRQLAELASRTTIDQRIDLGEGKRILRRAAQQILGTRPTRSKRGFVVPLGALLAGRWRAEAGEWLRGTPSELVDTRALADRYAEGRAGAVDLWALTTLGAWERRLSRAAAAPVP